MLCEASHNARVSTDMQSSGLEAQVRVLKDYFKQNGITNYEIFTDENQSGAKVSRPALDRMMKAVRDGEVSKVVVFSFSRFARSTTHLLSALKEFKDNDVQFVSLTEKIDTNSPMGLAMFTILSALSQMEREIIAVRVRAGLANARAKGIHIGRKKTRPSELIRALLKKKMKYREISSICNTSHGSINAERKLMLKEEQEKRETENLESTSIITDNNGKPTLTLV